MDSSHREPGIALLSLLLACHKASKEVAEHAELSIEEVFCLFILQEHRPQNVKALSRYLGVRSSRTSKILYSLEDRGFVVRSISVVDHRMEEVTLTPRGIDRIGRIVAFGRSLAESLPSAGGVPAATLPPAGSGRRTHSRTRPFDQEHN